ncbi:hypothetical protein MRX96_012802 [Rhipicephalus microplus]
MAEPQPNSETLSLRRAIRTLHRRRPPESHSSWSALTEPVVDHAEVPRPPSCRRAQPTESAVRLFEKNVNFFQGMFYATLNSALVGVISVLIKILYDVPTLQLTAMRLAGIFVFSLPLVIHSGHHPMGHPSNRVHLVLRATVGLAGLYFRFWSMKLIPLSDVAVILASLPVFVTALARVFLNEPSPLPFMQASGSREDKPDVDKYKGLVFALLSTIFGAAKFLISRTVRHEHHSVTLFMYGFVGVAECVLLSPTEPYVLPRCGLGRVIFASFTVLSFLEQLVLIKALQMENAGPVSVVIAAMDVVFMFAVELILFGNIPDKYSFTGATLVSVCVFLQMAKKTVTESHEKSLFRKLFYWLAY